MADTSSRGSSKGLRNLVGTALLTAIVFVLQVLGSFVRFGPFSISLVLVPIVVGAALYGAYSGLWLGFAFGIAVLVSGDAAAFLTINPIGTVVTVLLKGALAGLVSGIVYRALQKKNELLAAVCAAVVCPVVNTGLFLLGCRLFFFDTISEWAVGAGFGANVGSYMIVGLVGANFLIELAVNIILSPTIVRLVKFGRKAWT